MREVVPAILGTWLVLIAGLSFLWDAYDVVKQAGNHSVSEWIRGTWLRWPAGIAIGLLVASHFIRWPWK
jgi:hypothetical protein